MRLEGRVGIVTGAAQGIGEAIVRRLVCEGAKVLACDLNFPLVESLAAGMAKAGDSVCPYKADVSLSDEVRGMVGAALEKADIQKTQLERCSGDDPNQLENSSIVLKDKHPRSVNPVNTQESHIQQSNSPGR